jgi:hypothetical protein
VTDGALNGQDAPVSWGHNVGGFTKHFSGWLITAGPSGAGYAAQLRDRHGRARGQRFIA